MPTDPVERHDPARHGRRRAMIVAGVIAITAAAGLLLVVRSDDGTTDDAPGPTSTSLGADWRTDTSKATIELEELASGGPPKDGIPSIDEPKFETAEDVDWLEPREPVLVYAEQAYPIRILTWHEIVNDEVDETPVAVTYCPLCNTAVVFERRVDDDVLEFGVSGFLRHNDLVMYDRQTESLWQQFNGEGLVGAYADQTLKMLPSQVVSWEQFLDEHPDGRVLSQQTGHERDYGRNPYVGYDRPNSAPIFDSAQPDTRLDPKVRLAFILGSNLDGDAVDRAFVIEELDAPTVLTDDDVIVLWRPGVASALDAGAIADGRDVGTTAVFARRVGGQIVDFEPAEEPGMFRDVQTGSTWNMSGLAVSGERTGTRLVPVPHVDTFWFAIAAFSPDVELRNGGPG